MAATAPLRRSNRKLNTRPTPVAPAHNGNHAMLLNPLITAAPRLADLSILARERPAAAPP
ncbi:hypothetical protein GCM10020219_008090 [Nonomuraea dietziae]